jgi:hypothetical protein
VRDEGDVSLWTVHAFTYWVSTLSDTDGTCVAVLHVGGAAGRIGMPKPESERYMGEHAPQLLIPVACSSRFGPRVCPRGTDSTSCGGVALDAGHEGMDSKGIRYIYIYT